jgi:hypothetical protein
MTTSLAGWGARCGTGVEDFLGVEGKAVEIADQGGLVVDLDAVPEAAADLELRTLSSRPALTVRPVSLRTSRAMVSSCRSPFAFQTISGKEAAARLGEYRDLYTAVYAEPPYEWGETTPRCSPSASKNSARLKASP